MYTGFDMSTTTRFMDRWGNMLTPFSVGVWGKQLSVESDYYLLETDLNSVPIIVHVLVLAI